MLSLLTNGTKKRKYMSLFVKVLPITVDVSIMTLASSTYTSIISLILTIVTLSKGLFR